MLAKITLLYQFLFLLNPCNPPSVDVDCTIMRIGTDPVYVCEAYNKGVTWESVFIETKRGWRLLELWEDDRVSFKKYSLTGLWRNIDKGAITGIGKKPEWCGIKELNANRHS